MHRIDTSASAPLYGANATRALEDALAARLPPFELMSRAGTSVARLARALAPHARRIWVACGPGNNGGDGLVAARHLLEGAGSTGLEVVVTLCGNPDALPADAARALAQALASGMRIAEAPPGDFDIGIDALLGIGARDAPRGLLAEHLVQLHARDQPVLSVDLPTGLMPDTGRYAGPALRHAAGPRHTIALLTLKPGLFTADGRDLAGTVWFDPLDASTEAPPEPDAILSGRDASLSADRWHASHKGSQGDVVVVGGQGIGVNGYGMTGAAVLAARAALHAGAGRVYVTALDEGTDNSLRWDPNCPELMIRNLDALMRDRELLERATVVCGCGGGSAVARCLPALLSTCSCMVLDADALNRTAEDTVLRALLRSRHARDLVTVLTPHPLEAARLLDCTTAEVMNDRLAAACALSFEFGAICVLKGSGTVIAAPREVPRINSSGNPSLATAGTGDVLAGWIGAALAAPQEASATPFGAVLSSVYAHGDRADHWVRLRRGTLTANRLATGTDAP
jgi:ADP-dependent NAD(P)H-hydrate dehydratase / NAD(P)H-hydrate epimerase